MFHEAALGLRTRGRAGYKNSSDYVVQYTTRVNVGMVAEMT